LVLGKPVYCIVPEAGTNIPFDLTRIGAAGPFSSPEDLAESIAESVNQQCARARSELKIADYKSVETICGLMKQAAGVS
jgi:hypothetical protein